MFWSQNTVGFSILDVFELNQRNVRSNNRNRNFDAISFRIRARGTMSDRFSAKELQPGLIGYVPANVNYTRLVEEDQLIAIHFKNYTYYPAEGIEWFLPEHPEKYEVLFGKALQVWQEHHRNWRLQVGAILYQILAELNREQLDEKTEDPMITRAVAYLNRNFRNPELSPEQAAKEANISAVYLRKRFQICYGCSPKEYLTRRRMRYAISLLNAGYYSVAEVAELSGFRDPKYFATVFKERIGVSPSLYRYNFQR